MLNDARYYCGVDPTLPQPPVLDEYTKLLLLMLLAILLAIILFLYRYLDSASTDLFSFYCIILIDQRV